VARFALQNAALVASLMLTTEAMAVEKPEKKTLTAPAAAPALGNYDQPFLKPPSQTRGKPCRRAVPPYGSRNEKRVATHIEIGERAGHDGR
jgi:hypothetical protein